jgi:hypothetical protein
MRCTLPVVAGPTRVAEHDIKGGRLKKSIERELIRLVKAGGEVRDVTILVGLKYEKITWIGRLLTAILESIDRAYFYMCI